MNSAATAWTDLIEEHGSEAAFLFELRALAFLSFRQTLGSLAELDERLLAHLDGLAVSPAKSWDLFGAGLASDQPGEAFVAGWLALSAEDDAAMEPLEGALGAPASIEGLSGALRLAAGARIEERLARLATRAALPVRSLALDALAFRGKPVEPARARELLESTDPVGRMAGLNVTVRGRLRNLTPAVRTACADPAEWLAARAVQALAVLADREAAEVARGMTARSDRAGAAAIRLLGAIGGPADATRLAPLANGPQARDALLALGRLGDPGSAPVLLDALEDPKRARAAAHGLEILGGARIGLDRLARATPPPPPEDEEEDLAPDADDGLEWPDADRVRAWWERSAPKPKRGERWRAGAPFDWEAVAREAADPLAPLPDRDDALMELSARLQLDHAERRDWSRRVRAATPDSAQVRRRARDLAAAPWPAT